MSLRTVCATEPPKSNAPANSNTAATQMAWRSVRDLDATVVPKALATSLAPIPNAYKNPIDAKSGVA